MHAFGAVWSTKRSDDGRIVPGSQSKLYLIDPLLAWLPTLLGTVLLELGDNYDVDVLVPTADPDEAVRGLRGLEHAFAGVKVLGVRRGEEYFGELPIDITLAAGDALIRQIPPCPSRRGPGGCGAQWLLMAAPVPRWPSAWRASASTRSSASDGTATAGRCAPRPCIGSQTDHLLLRRAAQVAEGINRPRVARITRYG